MWRFVIWWKKDLMFCISVSTLSEKGVCQYKVPSKWAQATNYTKLYILRLGCGEEVNWVYKNEMDDTLDIL